MFSDLIKLVALAFSKSEEDMFYAPNQTVIDLTSLLENDSQKLKDTLANTQSDFIKNVSETLLGDWNLDWKQQHLHRSGLKASYDDLQQLQQILDEHEIPYRKMLRRNPVRFKSTYNLMMAKAGILPTKGHIHRDLKRHIQMQNTKA